MLQFQASRRLAKELNISQNINHNEGSEIIASAPWVFYGHILAPRQDKPDNLSLIIMEVETRYALLLTEIKKEYLTDFSSFFINRWHCELKHILHGQSSKLEKMLSLFCQNSELPVIFKTDRSVQSHIRQVGRELDLTRKRLGRSPLGHHELYEFGYRANHMFRKNSPDSKYFYPHTKMMEKINKQMHFS